MQKSIETAITTGALADLADRLAGATTSDLAEIARRMSGDGVRPATLLTQATALAKRTEREGRLLACQLLPHTYDLDPERTVRILARLVDDGDWTVRDGAATAAGRLLRADFRGMLPHVRGFAEDASATVRRAAVVAAGRAAHPHHLERAEPLLKLLAPLLPDPDPALRRALGPSALGGGLLRHYPRITFEYLTQWSTSNDANVLWNVTAALSSPAATPIAKKALIILRKLSLDERRFVWRAVASAIWKLGRKCPEIVRPELARWIEDERRVDVARAALQHL